MKNMTNAVTGIIGMLTVAAGLSACTTNPYNGESEVGKSGIGAGLGAALGAGIGMLSSSKHDRGKGALIGATAGAALGGVAMVLKEYEKTAVNVVGYTDSSGAKAHNMTISQQRADSVSGTLITQGVTARRIHSTGAGLANPVATNSTSDG